MAHASTNELGSDQAGRATGGRLVHEAAEQMDAIEADFGSDCEIGSVVTIVEVIGRDGAEVRVRSNVAPWVGLGLLRFAEKALDEPGERTG